MARTHFGFAILAFACALAPALTAGEQRAPDTTASLGHWQLVVDPQGAPAPVLRSEAYRLMAGGYQLSTDLSEPNRIVLRAVDVRTPDTWLHRGNGRPADGTLNESRAIYLSSVRGYLIVKPNAGGLGLAIAPYGIGDESDATLPSSIAQWQFQTLPDGQTRDHRHRPMATTEVFALYNVIVKAYLVFDRSTQSLRWMAR